MNGFVNPGAGNLTRNGRLGEIAADGAAAQAAARTNLGISAALVGSSALRNRIVNGGMQIDQANAGAAVVVNASVNVFSADKWKGFGTPAAGVYSMQQTAGGPNGFKNFLRITVTTPDAAPAAGSAYIVSHNIEGNYCTDLQFGLATLQSVTLGIWVRASVAGNYSGALRNAASTRSYPFTIACPVANTWTFVPIVIPADQIGVWLTDNTTGISLHLDMGCGANFRGVAGAWNGAANSGVTGAASLIGTNGATFDFTGVQLEPGTVASTFEQVAFPDMLQRCQREFCKSFNLATAPVQNAGANTGEAGGFAILPAAVTDRFQDVYWPVTMRVAPAIVFFNPAAANNQARDLTGGLDCSATATSWISDRAMFFSAVGNVASAANDRLGVHWTADARL